MTLFIPDMAGRLFLLILLFDTFQYLKAKDLPQPSLTVIPAVIKERDSVQLNCQTPSVSECYFKMEGQVEFTLPSPCQHELTGTLLVRWTGQSSPAEVKIQCQYSATGSQFRSMFSEPSTVTIQDLPQLTVSSTVIRETESVQLSCETPPSRHVSNCYFYIEVGKNFPRSLCTQTITGTELLKRAGPTFPAVVKVKCYYAVGRSHTSPLSNPVSVTVQDPKPDITVQFDEDFTIICLIPGSVSPDSTCNLYVGEESQPSFTAKIKKRKATSAAGEQFCQFTPKHSDLISGLQSVRSKEVSCDYGVSSGPNSLSPRSDGKSFAHLVGVHISDPTTKHFPAAGSTVSSTLTPNTPVRPTTYRPTKCLTSPLTPSTALNPSSGSTLSSTLTTDTPSKGQSSTDIVVNSNSQESVPLSSTLTSSLTPGFTVRPTTSLTSPLTPSTAVNPPSGGQSSTESVLAGLTVTSTLTPDITVRPTRGQSSTDSVVDSTAPLTLTPDITVRPTTTVQLWQAVVGVASGVGVFLMGLTAVCLCRRTKKHSQRPTARQDDHRQYDLVMGAVNSAGMLDSKDAGIYSLITSVPSTFLPSGHVQENGQSSEKDNSDTYHVYSSIPNRPATSAQPDGLYSLLQTH